MKLIPSSAVVATLGLWVCLILFPSAALAQGAIAGQVTDESGSLMPGVTVEATSPVLIEGTRATVSDGQGRYQIHGPAAGLLQGHLFAGRFPHVHP